MRNQTAGKLFLSCAIIDSMDDTKRPPNDRGQGRKPLAEGEATVTVSLRLTEGLRAKLARLGGAQWVRDKISQAKEPK